MLSVIDNTIIYICSPANVATGGPEALHHLCYSLNEFGYNAKMVYNNKKNDPVHHYYKKYNNQFVKLNDVIDNTANILLVPESYPYPYYLNKFKSIQKSIWWLSVDGSLAFKSHKSLVEHNSAGHNCLFHSFIKVIHKNLISFINSRSKCMLIHSQIKNKYTYFKRELFLTNIKYFDYSDPCLVNLCQSYYAFEYVKNKLGASNISLLFEPLGKEYLDYQKEEPFNPSNRIKKENLVIYYPRKGFEYTKLIINEAPDITFLPIENMTNEDILNLLIKAKVYIDFGPFPGSDRIPRQAACCGCCLITGRFGAANYYDDVKIDDEYKFSEPEKHIKEIVNKIHECIDNYDIKIIDFEAERQKVLNEEKMFHEHIDNTFIKN